VEKLQRGVYIWKTIHTKCKECGHPFSYRGKIHKKTKTIVGGKKKTLCKKCKRLKNIEMSRKFTGKLKRRTRHVVESETN
jgi:5-methylcytosine-specific restriction endonuclease McrA